VSGTATIRLLVRDSPQDDWRQHSAITFSTDAVTTADEKATRAGEQWVAEDPVRHRYEVVE
jgi:hypothetical protein